MPRGKAQRRKEETAAPNGSVIVLATFRNNQLATLRLAAERLLAIFSVSILYLAAVRARCESFASDWLVLYPGQYNRGPSQARRVAGRLSYSFISPHSLWNRCFAFIR
jgi:hypothetical protein